MLREAPACKDRARNRPEPVQTARSGPDRARTVLDEGELPVNAHESSSPHLVIALIALMLCLAALPLLGPIADTLGLPLPTLLRSTHLMALFTLLGLGGTLIGAFLLARRAAGAGLVKAGLVELVERLSEGLVLLDERGRIVSVNRELQTLFGYAPEDLAGHPLQKLLPEFSWERCQARAGGAGTGEPPILGEFAGRTRTGDEVLVRLRQGPVLPSERGSLTALLVRDLTHSRKTEMVIRTQDAHLRLMLEQMPGILWTTDSQLQITSSQGAGMAALKLDPREVIGMSMQEYLEADRPDCTAIAAHQAALRGQSLNYEMTWKQRTFQVRVDPLRDAGQRIIGTIGVVLDVTESKQKLAALLARERQQAAVAALGDRALAGLEIDALLKEAAEVVCRTLDSEFCQVLEALPAGVGLRLRAGSGWKLRPGEEVLLPVGDGSHAGWALARNEPVQIEELGAQKSFRPSRLLQTHGVVSGVCVPIPGKGRAFGALGTHTAKKRRFRIDEVQFLQAVAQILASAIERKQAEQAQQRLAAILEATTDVVAMAGPDRRLLYLNRAGRQLFGLRLDEDVSRRTLTDFYAEDALHRFLHRELPQALETGACSSETCFRQATGRNVFVSQVILAQKQADGAKSLLSIIARDLTERHNLEEQLRQSQKMEAVGRLAGGVAHDFNNLLTVINGYGEILLESTPGDDPRQSYAQEIKKAGDRASALTRQLLAFSRRQLLVPRVLNLNTLVADMDKMLRRLIGEDVELEIHLDGALRVIKADPGQIEQVLMNLVVNARDAMPRGGKLTIATRNVHLDGERLRERPEVLPGPYVQLLVRDTGCGMDAETRKHIFEPFFTTKEKGKGTGLGLATVYGIVKQSEGHIEVVSQPGKGTTFSIFLPRLEVPAEGAESVATPTELPRGNETVLLVEDEDGVRALARQVLRQSGYEVLEASQGEEALALSNRHKGPIHLLLSDVVMPKLSGVELYERLRPQRPETRVLFMSGFTDTALLRYEVMTGEVDCFLKPFTPQTLTRMVREVLDRRADERPEFNRAATTAPIPTAS
jgi:PAS domain S-box-containing protein